MPRRRAVPSVQASRPGATSAVSRRILPPLFFLFMTIILGASAMVGGCGGRKKIDMPMATEPTQPAASQPLPTAAEPSTLPAAGPLLVRVGLSTGVADLQLTATGDAFLLLDQMRRRETRVSGGATLALTRRGDGVAWRTGGHSGTAEVVVLQPVDPAYRVIAPDAERSGQTLALRGEVVVFPNRDGRGLTVVNVVELEAYLRGVVPWEIGRHGRDAVAALAAQAVAARTYTVSHLGAREALGFDLWAGIRDQVYRGAADEDPVCNDAIAGTAGQVLIHAGEPITAYYSSTCGGITSQIEEVWPRRPELYLVSHPDRPTDGGEVFCAGAKYFHWQESWSGKQLESILARTLPRYVKYMSNSERATWAGPAFSPHQRGDDPGRPGPLRGIAVVRLTRSGRVAQLDITTAAGIYHLRGDRVRWVLVPASGKPAILRSARFELTVEMAGDRVRRVTAHGGGYGHGVGLCQVGALQMARSGYGVEAILSHYYPGATLTSFTAGEGR